MILMVNLKLICNHFAESQYSNLCALCEKPEVCDYPDVNSGYEGALNCLTKGGGDIAWTKTLYVDKYFGVSYKRYELNRMFFKI